MFDRSPPAKLHRVLWMANLFCYRRWWKMKKSASSLLITFIMISTHGEKMLILHTVLKVNTLYVHFQRLAKFQGTMTQTSPLEFDDTFEFIFSSATN